MLFYYLEKDKKYLENLEQDSKNLMLLEKNNNYLENLVKDNKYLLLLEKKTISTWRT